MQQSSTVQSELGEVQDSLERLRQARGWSQEQMAKHLDVSRSYYNQIENKSKPLKAGKLFKRAKIMMEGEFPGERSPVNSRYSPTDASDLLVEEARRSSIQTRIKPENGSVKERNLTGDNALLISTLEAEMYRVLEAFEPDDAGRNFQKEIVAIVCAYVRKGASMGASSEVIYHDLLRRLPPSAWDYLKQIPKDKE